jgi:hypothetical protein
MKGDWTDVKEIRKDVVNLFFSFGDLTGMFAGGLRRGGFACR